MRATTLLLLSFAALPVAANNVYKWTDAAGQVHYSQTPPANGASTVQPQKRLQPGVSLQAPPAPPKAVTPVVKPTKAVAAPETKVDKTKRCAESKTRTAYLEEKTARRLMVTQPDGSESRMTEEEFDKHMTQAKEAGKGC